MTPESADPHPSSSRARQTSVERGVERAIVLFAKAMVAMAFIATAYSVLVASFFLCCGTDGFSYANPTRSPLGPVLTIVVVWPIVGFVCLFLQGGLEEILKAVGNGVRAAIRVIYPK